MRMNRKMMAVVAVALAATALAHVSCATTSLGAAPAPETLSGSTNFSLDDETFVNPIETSSGLEDFATARDVISRYAESEQAAPGKIPMAVPPDFDAPPADDVRVTWIGHSTMLVEIDGFRVLTDPIWSERCSPFQTVGPKRMHPPAVDFDDLPPIDAVVISHDHYDHLDYETIKQLAWRRVPFLVPLGIGSHLDAWGVKNYRELDWWDEATITKAGATLKLVATPARHFSGRGLLDRNRTLWASWAIVGERHRAYFGGDTGYFPGFAEIGERLGPFDVTMMPIGAYDPAWADIHMNPEEAVRAHVDMGNTGLLLPIHYATFNLAIHSWAEPMERFAESSEAANANAYFPLPGEGVLAAETADPTRWWAGIEPPG